MRSVLNSSTEDRNNLEDIRGSYSVSQRAVTRAP